MGDQVGVAVSGTLYYVPFPEFERVRNLPIESVDRTTLFAALCRINTLYMIARAGSGHIGSSFSSMDIMSWLLLNEVRGEISVEGEIRKDVFFSSKGHDAPGLYNVWLGMGKLQFELIHKLRRIDGLPGHPDVSIPNVVTNTGSLGMGVSKAKGLIFAMRRRMTAGTVYVLTGDGELQEGQFWESLISAANHRMGELIVIIDHNKLQSDTLVSKVSDLGDLEAKLRAFGWYVGRCNGNDIQAFADTLSSAKKDRDKPKVIIADTIKGKGVSFMEHTSIDSDVEFYKFHSGAPSDDAYIQAVQELIATANSAFSKLGFEEITLETVDRPRAVSTVKPERLVQAYSAALLDQAERNDKIVALDADLILDTGLIPFKQRFPDRFVECGIAEQDMVSQAGGMALGGMLPVVHSFACFLSSRPNEQIYNNSSERSKIIYVGSLAGMLPGGPGHSHQAVRDIASLAAVPDLTIIEPSCEAEVAVALDWAINVNAYSTYLRLVSIPWELGFDPAYDRKYVKGQGHQVRHGKGVCVFAYGPVLLSLAMKAATLLEEQHGVTVRVVNMPWLNTVSGEWLRHMVEDVALVVTLDNHYSDGGLGANIGKGVLALDKFDKKFLCIGLDEIPKSGQNNEVLRAHGFDPESIARRIHVSWCA